MCKTWVFAVLFTYMRIFFVILLASIGLLSSEPVVEQIPVSQEPAKKEVKKPFLIVERMFPCSGTVHKARFFYKEMAPKENFLSDKNLVILPIRYEAEAALKEFNYPRTRSVLTGEDFTLGEVLSQFITLMDTTIVSFKKSKKTTESVRVKFDFLNSARDTMGVIDFKKEGKKITADIQLCSFQPEAPQDVVNFLQVVLCDDPLSSKSVKSLGSLGVRRGLFGALCVGGVALFMRALLAPFNQASSDIIARINATYPGAYGEFKGFLGTDIQWAKHTKNPRIAIIILHKGCSISALKDKLGSADLTELRGVELYRVLYDNYLDLTVFCDDFIPNIRALGLVFPHEICTEIAGVSYFSSEYAPKDWASSSHEGKLPWQTRKMFQEKLIKELEKKFKTIERDVNSYSATFSDKGIDFRLHFAVEPLNVVEPYLFFSLEKSKIKDDSPCIKQTLYKTRDVRSFTFCDAKFLIYRDLEKNLIVLIANGEKKEYEDFNAFIEGLTARVVEVVSKSKKRDTPITPSEYFAEFNGSVIKKGFEQRVVTRKKNMARRLEAEVQEQLVVHEVSSKLDFPEQVLEAGKFYAVLCNLSDFTSEYVQALKTFMQTNSSHKNYKIYVIQNTNDSDKLALFQNVGGGLTRRISALLSDSNICLLQPDLGGIDRLIDAIEREFFDHWVSGL